MIPDTQVYRLANSKFKSLSHTKLITQSWSFDGDSFGRDQHLEVYTFLTTFDWSLELREECSWYDRAPEFVHYMN